MGTATQMNVAKAEASKFGKAHAGLDGDQHDHVISGAPGFGINGTAGTFNPFWRVFDVMYNPSVFNGKAFTPVKSTAELDLGEASGMFLPINSGAANPYEVDTGIVFLCNIVSSHA